MADTVTERMLWHRNDIKHKPEERLITGHRDTELVYRMLTDKFVVDAVKNNELIGYQIPLHFNLDKAP